jgi:hypothetical protein
VISKHTFRLIDAIAVAFCGLGLHRWNEEQIRRICLRCQRIHQLGLDTPGCIARDSLEEPILFN